MSTSQEKLESKGQAVEAVQRAHSLEDVRRTLGKEYSNKTWLKTEAFEKSFL